MNSTRPQKIIAVHLLNDFSGSPRVLSNEIEKWIEKDYKVEIWTSSPPQGGLLSNFNAHYEIIPYRFFENKWLRLITYLKAQLILFIKLSLALRQESATVYINTYLPFGAALAAKLTGNKVIYHLHELGINPKLLGNFLKRVVHYTADEIIVVSDYMRQQINYTNKPIQIKHNRLSKDFCKKAEFTKANYIPADDKPFIVLMITSLKSYKGVDDFVLLAYRLPQYRFELLLNATQDEIDTYFKDKKLAENLFLYPQESDVHSFYARANVLVNLSDPNYWIETFGMTILEGMYYGLPCIVPKVGGPIELVENERHGYLLSNTQIIEIACRIQMLQENEKKYSFLSRNALRKALTFT